MLITSGMEKRFWAEAVATAVKLINKCPSSSIGGDTPDLRWYGSYGDYSQLRTFGSKAFAYLKQTKLDSRAQKCVMLGYQQGVKGYRLWCIEPGNHKVVISRDVTFVEDDMSFKRPEEKAQYSLIDIEVGVESQKKVVQVEAIGPNESELLSSDEDEAESEPPQPDLRSYQLTRDRIRRQNVKPSTRFTDADMLYFALCVAEEIEFLEP